MKKSLLLLNTLFILILPTLANSAQNRPGPYGSLFLGVSLLDDIDVTTDEYIGSLTTYYDRIESDPGVFVGGTVGYDFGIVRLEGELSYKQNEMDRITDRVARFNYGGVDGDIGIFAAMVNAFVDFHNDSPVTPYIGGGAGVATIYLSDTYGTDTYGNRYRLYSEDDESVFAYQAGGGLDFALNRQTSIDLGYRYFETEEAEFTSDSFQSKKLKCQSHNIAVGIRFKF